MGAVAISHSSDQLVPAVDVRDAGASSVIVHPVPTELRESFLEWQRGITEAAAGFPDYQRTDIYPPSDASRTEWVVIIHFNDPEALQRWLDAPLRAEWTAKLPKALERFRLKFLPEGLGPWFADQIPGREQVVPPGWKMVLTVLLGLYPTVVLLTVVVGPVTNPLGFAVSMLIGNALSVAILQWIVMPVLSRWFDGWLRANGKLTERKSMGGLVLIVALVSAMTVLFRVLIG